VSCRLTAWVIKDAGCGVTLPLPRQAFLLPRQTGLSPLFPIPFVLEYVCCSIYSGLLTGVLTLVNTSFITGVITLFLYSFTKMLQFSHGQSSLLWRLRRFSKSFC
jgi:hypothetical protein